MIRTNVNAQLISIKKLDSLVLFNMENKTEKKNENLVLAFNAELMNLGYIMSKPLFEILHYLEELQLTGLYKNTINTLKNIVGEDAIYNPMYPNFPQQVQEASDFELFFNAIVHYWSYGTWKPVYAEKEREFAFENTEFKTIDLASEEDFVNIFRMLLNSSDSISEEDKEIVKYFITRFNENELLYPDVIPFKENMCYVAGIFLEDKKDISNIIKTSTDVLRVATYLSGGDISLADNTKFKSLPRSTRKTLVKLLENVICEEDIQRHRNKWNKLFHNLHVGEYSKKVLEIATKVRENIKLETFNSKVESFLLHKGSIEIDVVMLVKLLKERPGEFARRLDHVLRSIKVADERNYTLNHFAKIVDLVPSKILLSMLGNLKTRNTDTDEIIVFPKGSMQKAVVVDVDRKRMAPRNRTKLIKIIETSLKTRFATLGKFDSSYQYVTEEGSEKVYIDESLKGCPLPSQQRSASEGMFSVARGTRFNFGDDSTLRMFIYWIGDDVDLSATFHNEDFKELDHISYTNLRIPKYGAYHSGDITYAPAPNGASEFIDIDIEKTLTSGVRYVVMNVYEFSGIKYSDYEKCYAGWMTRNKPLSNEIYEPKTVKQKVDLTSEGRNAIPAIFDLKTRQVIWADMDAITRTQHRGNNVESNRASTEQILKSIVKTVDNKVTLYDLFTYHAEARGNIVDDIEVADVVFNMDNAYKTNEINSEFIV